MPGRRNTIIACAMLMMASAPSSGQTTAPPVWAAEPQLRIGSIDGPSALTRVTAAAVGQDGVLYVAQPMDAVVRMFDRQGRYIGALGRRGDGPGEFRIPLHLGWVQDSLWVFDIAAQRLTFWMKQSTVGSINIQPPDPGADYNPPSLVAMLHDGSFLMGVVPRTTTSGRRTVDHGFVARMSRNGSPMQQITTLSFSTSPSIDHQGSRIFLSNQPFDDASILRVSPDGRKIVRIDRRTPTRSANAAFTVTAFDAGGATLFSREFAYRPIRMTREAVEAALEIPDARFLERFPSRAAALEAIRGGLITPENHPPITDAVVASDRRIWLRREDTGRPTTTWIVIDPRGNIIAQTTLPRGLKVLYAGESELIGSETDEFGTPYLVTYRVAPPRNE
jgi:hypothetical protein